MVFRLIDTFFEKIKKLISIVNLVFIILSIYVFVYWILSVSHIVLPEYFSFIAIKLITFFSIFVQDKTKLSELVEIYPVFVSIILCIFAYSTNILMTFVEMCQSNLKKYVENYKRKLEYKINIELHNDFLNDLKKTSFLLIKYKLTIIKEKSYILDPELEQINSQELATKILNKTLSKITFPDVQEKGISDDSVYIISNNLENAQDLFGRIVDVISSSIKENTLPKLKFNLTFASEVFDDYNNLSNIQKNLDKILSLNIVNKLIVTPKFKIYYENLYPNIFNFVVTGSYNLSDDQNSMKNTNLYALTRK